MPDDPRLAPPVDSDLADAAEMLWVVLANVSGGDWTKSRFRSVGWAAAHANSLISPSVLLWCYSTRFWRTIDDGGVDVVR